MQRAPFRLRLATIMAETSILNSKSNELFGFGFAHLNPYMPTGYCALLNYTLCMRVYY